MFSLNKMDSFLDSISKSPAMIGMAVLVINLGGRFLAGDITRYDEKVLNNPFMKKLTIFCIAFLSTRDVRYSILIVFLFSILFHPCGLAYKIMKKTQHSLLNPFNTLIRKRYLDKSEDSILFKEEKNTKSIRIFKINI